MAADHFKDWGLADRLLTDPTYKKALGAVGIHYTGIGTNCSTPNARNCGVPIWASETWG